MNPLNQTEEKREAVPNGVSRVGIAVLGVLLQVLWIVWAALKLTRYYAWVQLAISVLAFLLALRIYHTNSATKLSWIIVILTFPIFGVCLYLLFGRSGAVNIMRGRFTRTDTELQPHYATPLDRAAMPQDPALQNQIHYLQTQAHYPACRNTDVTYYGDTNAALEAQKTDLRKAQHFIFMEYHAIEDSIAWQGIEDILAEHAIAAQSVYEFEDMVADKHMAARGNFVEWETKDGDTFKGLSPMPRFEQTPGQIWRPMPAQGGDTMDTLTKLGYTAEQVQELAEKNVVKIGEN